MSQHPPIPEPIAEISRQIRSLQEQLREARRAQAPESVGDYVLRGPEGELRLSELLAETPDLLVVHNMGRGCPYCTLWADGFVGLADHLGSRAGFVIVSPDSPEEQAAFAESRGWPFRMLSDEDGAFTRDMGYLLDEGGYWPGVSAFRLQEDGGIVRTGNDIFGPGDAYNATWHLFDLLEGGPQRWQPRFSYEA